MVWSQLDFEREVRRQLIELRSLRKRVPADGDLLQRIEGLEASHHGLLRRLGDLFLSPSEPGVSATATSTAAASTAATSTAGAGSVRSTRAAERLTLGKSATTSTASRTARLAVLEEAEELNGQELCPRCGRLLLPSLLSGERVVQLDCFWLHASCLENKTGGGERPYGPL